MIDRFNDVVCFIGGLLYTLYHNVDNNHCLNYYFPIDMLFDNLIQSLWIIYAIL